MHIKDFNEWNKQKQYIDKEHQKFHCKPRQVWWSSLGINIGSEIDGKNGKFERPVIILKFISLEMVLIIPLTTRGKPDKNNFKVRIGKTDSLAKITLIRAISAKRLLRQIGTLDKGTFTMLKTHVSNYIRE